MSSEESLIEFPCTYEVKAMGKDSDDFHAAVREILRSHVAALDESAISHRASSKGSYISLTAAVYVENREHLEKIYLDLRASQHVLFTL